MTSILSMTDVQVCYDRAIHVLKGVSLEVPEKGAVALLGANGAGKSTTLKAISNLLHAEGGEVISGRIEFMGESIVGLDPALLVSRGIFQVMEGRRLFAQLTVEENLRTGAYARKGGEHIRRDLDMVYGYFPQLANRRSQKAGYLSGGEQQMVAIGRALMARPRLVLLDEPSMGLAPLLVQEIFSIVDRMRRDENLSILLAEQNAKLALSIVQAGYVMEDGRIVHEGPMEKLKGDRDIRQFYLGMTEPDSHDSYRAIVQRKRAEARERAASEAT